MAFIEIGSNISISKKAWDGSGQEIFVPNLVNIISTLHQKFEPRRQELLKARKNRQEKFDAGSLPSYEDKTSEACTGDWKIKNIPQDFMQRRVEITGPVNDPKMVINMLSRNSEGYRADTAMVDFEDSMKPSFDNVIQGIKNVIAAANGNLRFEKTDANGKVEKSYVLDPNDMAGLMVRVRGLHLNESNFKINHTPVHGGLLELAACFYHTADTLLKKNKTPKFYIPKCEHHEEASWWNDVFTELENLCGYDKPTLRATFLIETLPAAFQIEEILFAAKEHIIGLNVGRWDKIFSDIKVLKNHADRISADRATINMQKFWMDHYAKRLIKICHSRGAFAIGGMSAFTPGRDEETRNQQTEKVFQDKSYEAEIGHDGCWVSHPYFIGHAMKAFTQDNQLSVTLDNFDKFPDLIMDGKGPRTIQGLRTNIRVGIAYLRGWNQNLGCVSWDNLMEDLATLEISRAQTWQWLHHQIKLESGETVTKDLINNLFSEELTNIINELNINENNEIKNEFIKAKDQAFTLFTQEKLDDFLSENSDLY